MTRRRKNDITVNGIGLMEIMRIKMTTITKKTPIRKTVPRDKKKQAHMSTPPVGNITNYLTIRKRESNDITSNSKKTTPGTQDSLNSEDHHNDDSDSRKKDKDSKQNNIPKIKNKITFGAVSTPPPIKKNIFRFQDMIGGGYM